MNRKTAPAGSCVAVKRPLVVVLVAICLDAVGIGLIFPFFPAFWRS